MFGCLFRAAQRRGAATVQTLSISTRFGADPRSIAASLSFLLSVPLKFPYRRSRDHRLSRDDGSSRTKFHDGEFRMRAPNQSRRRRPKPKSTQTNCRAQIYERLHPHVRERARSRAQIGQVLARKLSIPQPVLLQPAQLELAAISIPSSLSQALVRELARSRPEHFAPSAFLRQEKNSERARLEFLRGAPDCPSQTIPAPFQPIP